MGGRLDTPDDDACLGSCEKGFSHFLSGEKLQVFCYLSSEAAFAFVCLGPFLSCLAACLAVVRRELGNCVQ